MTEICNLIDTVVQWKGGKGACHRFSFTLHFANVYVITFIIAREIPTLHTNAVKVPACPCSAQLSPKSAYSVSDASSIAVIRQLTHFFFFFLSNEKQTLCKGCVSSVNRLQSVSWPFYRDVPSIITCHIIKF